MASVMRFDEWQDSNGNAVASGTGGVFSAPGSILQVVSTTVIAEFSTTSTTPAAYTNLSASITPSSTSSKIYISYSGLGRNSAGTEFQARVYQGGSTISAPLTRGLTGVSDRYGPMVVTFLHSPATTSALSYQVYVNSTSSGTSSYSESTLTVFEVAG